MGLPDGKAQMALKLGACGRRQTDMRHADKIDMSFKYTPSRLTDVAKTFARVRKQMAEAAKAEQAKPVKVLRLRKG